MKSLKKINLQRILLYFAMSFGALFMALPFYFMITTSFKGMKEVRHIDILSTLWVHHPTLETYRQLFEGLPYLKFMWNSFIVALAVTIGTLFFSTLAGFAFAKLKFLGRDKIFFAILATIMIPGSVLLVPGFLLMRDFGWLNTFLPLIVPAWASSFSIFLSRQFIKAIPDDMIDAAKIDGCSNFSIYWHIILPLSKPLLATMAILTFLYSWNNFINPLIYLQDENLYTLPLGISLLQGRFQRIENIQMAGATLAIIPVIIIFFLLQKQIVKSLSTTGLKG